MIIKKVELNNISSFKDNNIFDFSVDKERNIILIGGKNGSGKTSLLEALKLCFYGSFLFNNRTKEYQNYLSKFIRLGENEASISIEFSTSELNQINNYKLQRIWVVNDNKIKESLLLMKNSKPLDDISSEYWQDFLLELIPLGLIDFFFFDGEKIESMAEDMDDGKISSAVKDLFGITVLDYLQNTLDQYKDKILKANNASNNFDQKIEEFHYKDEMIKKELANIHSDIAEANTSIGQLERNLGRVESELFSKGGQLYENFQSMELRKESIAKEIELIEKEIRELAGGLLPLCIYEAGLEELEAELHKSLEGAKSKQVNEYLDQKKEDLSSLLNKRDIDSEVLEALLGELKISVDYQGVDFNLSERQTYDVISQINEAKNVTKPKSLELFNTLEELNKQLSEIENAISKAPKEDALQELYIELSDIRKKIDDKSNERNKLEDKQRRLVFDQENNIRAINKLRDEQEKAVSNKRIFKLLEGSKDIISEFEVRFKQRKIIELEDTIVDNLHKLHRKVDLIEKVKIDADSFEIRLFDRKSNEVNKDRLSAGERQIFALALVWSLSMLSNKNIPCVVDTPLSRLDSEHRINLAKNYYPYASHQMFLLSTDEEIDEKLKPVIEPHIAKEYLLSFNTDSESTIIENSYFNFEVTNEV